MEPRPVRCDDRRFRRDEHAHRLRSSHPRSHGATSAVPPASSSALSTPSSGWWNGAARSSTTGNPSRSRPCSGRPTSSTRSTAAQRVGDAERQCLRRSRRTPCRVPSASSARRRGRSRSPAVPGVLRVQERRIEDLHRDRLAGLHARRSAATSANPCAPAMLVSMCEPWPRVVGARVSRPSRHESATRIELLAPRALLDLAVEHRVEHRQERPGIAERAPHHGRTNWRKFTNADTGFPGSPKSGLAGERARTRAACPASSAPSRTRSASPEHFLHEVEVADAHAARRDDDVRRRGALERRADRRADRRARRRIDGRGTAVAPSAASIALFDE